MGSRNARQTRPLRTQLGRIRRIVLGRSRSRRRGEPLRREQDANGGGAEGRMNELKGLGSTTHIACAGCIGGSTRSSRGEADHGNRATGIEVQGAGRRRSKSGRRTQGGLPRVQERTRYARTRAAKATENLRGGGGPSVVGIASARAAAGAGGLGGNSGEEGRDLTGRAHPSFMARCRAKGEAEARLTGAAGPPSQRQTHGRRRSMIGANTAVGKVRRR